MTMQEESIVPATSVSRALARDRLGVLEIGSAIASSVAPLTVVALVVITALAVTGLIGVPVAILAVAAILMVFAVGYMAMSRHIDNAGAFYAYVAQGLGRPLGVGTAWFALFVYNSFQLCCYGGIGALAALTSPLIRSSTGIAVAWWVFAFAAWAVVGLLGAHEVKLSGRILMVLVILETVLVVAFTVAIMLTPGFHFSLDALSVRNLWMPGVGTLIVLGMTAYAGIEQSVVYGEESKNRERTIPRATYGTILVVAAVYVFASVVVISAGGPQIIGRASAEGSELFFTMSAVVLGQTALLVGKAALGSSLFAAAVSFHQAIARYVFALGREGVLPRTFGATVKGGAPRNASIVQTAFAFCVLATYAIAGWDPLVQLFYWGSTTGGLGILLLITLTSAAVIVYFWRDSRGESLWHRRIAPLLATVILLFVSVKALQSLPIQYAVEGGTGPARAVPIALLVVFAAGTGWGVVLRFLNPPVYAGIGRGTRSATVL
ncbi:amino acid permease [Actinoplanes sp. NBRC 14428]|uniref:Amino acid transporter n=1 Tax=Pseudosporangium ferrugineum TaxID=439699 RepID=A0A2T0SAW3_9ACTN|nr:APC family permease [Pseudosporangium ferrugineum]PRY30521.1 amino acid transporter [Pseudosporangium ferrugineum]BCJ50056.1 amino acid permease [Actinoplanes sp. NBRC 14428]